MMDRNNCSFNGTVWNESFNCNKKGGMSTYSVNKLFYAIGSVLCLIVCVAIIIVNGFHIICLFKNRKKEWFRHSKNIMSIVAVDFVVGITSLMMTITSSMTDVNFFTCVLSQGLCLSAQLTTMLSILRMCVLRIVSTRRLVPGREASSYSIISQTFVIYILSSLICLLPVFTWSKYTPVLPRCTWGQIFQEKTIQADKYMLATLLIPTVLTTTFYVYLCFYLRKRQSAVFPACSPGTNESSSAIWMTDISAKNKTVDHEALTKVTNITSPNKPDKNFLTVPSSSSSAGGNTMTSPRKIFQSRQTEANTKPKSNMSARDRRLKAVVKTIGVILFCANASVLPFVVLLVVKIAMWPAQVDPFYGFLTSFFLMLNSITDPLIYALTLKHMNNAFRVTLLRCLRCQCQEAEQTLT